MLAFVEAFATCLETALELASPKPFVILTQGQPFSASGCSRSSLPRSRLTKPPPCIAGLTSMTAGWTVNFRRTNRHRRPWHLTDRQNGGPAHRGIPGHAGGGARHPLFSQVDCAGGRRGDHLSGWELTRSCTSDRSRGSDKWRTFRMEHVIRSALGKCSGVTPVCYD